jgi:hypothetical protein
MATPSQAISESPGTDYVVLHTTDGQTWAQYDKTFRAHNDKQAIKLAIQDGLDQDGRAYVAVPSRSWTPRTPTVDTKPTVKF